MGFHDHIILGCAKAQASDEELYDLVREDVVIFTGALATHLGRDDAKVHAVVEKLLDVLNTPSEDVQRAVSSCLSPLMKSKQTQQRVCLGIRSLKNCGIATIIREGLADRNSAKSREGALLAFECLYVIQMLTLLFVGLSDPVMAVRDAAECAARAMMSHLSAQGVKLVLPSLLKGLEDKAWRTKQSSVQLLGAMAYCAPQLLYQCLPKIMPKLIEVLTYTYPKVQSAGQTALQQVGNVIKNLDIASLVPTLLMGLTDPNDHTRYSVDILLQAKPSAISAHTATFGPVLTECLKDGIPPVRLAAERCDLHTFELTNGTENVQAAHRKPSCIGTKDVIYIGTEGRSCIDSDIVRVGTNIKTGDDSKLYPHYRLRYDWRIGSDKDDGDLSKDDKIF
ncbi:eIF-2-alpha kinase activator GCN1 [Orobanche hederae]